MRQGLPETRPGNRSVARLAGRRRPRRCGPSQRATYRPVPVAKHVAAPCGLAAARRPARSDYLVASLVCLIAALPLQAGAQEEPSSAPVSQPGSAPASLPASTSLPAVQPASAPAPEPVAASQPTSDPWSGAALVIEPARSLPLPVGGRSPGAAQAIAWSGFGAGALLALGGGSALLGLEIGESPLPGIALVSGGGLLLVVGPALGHLYAGEVSTAFKQAGIAGAVVGGSVAVALAARLATAPLEEDPLRITLSLLPLTFGGAFALQYAVRMAEDAPNAVKRMNQKRVRAKLLPTPGGLALWGEF